MRKALIVFAVAVAVFAGWLLHDIGGAQKANAEDIIPGVKYEYKVVGFEKTLNENGLERRLNEMGSQGFRYHSYNTVAGYKLNLVIFEKAVK